MTRHVKQIERPILARGVRYRWDDVRSQHQLLYPEGLLVLNETGAAIVGLCDGRAVEEIKRELSGSFSAAELEDDVDEFLGRLVQRGLIRHDDHA
jgi:pyrroloquinoline quinone biosynthesis protein D